MTTKNYEVLKAEYKGKELQKRIEIFHAKCWYKSMAKAVKQLEAAQNPQPAPAVKWDSADLFS